VVGFLYHQDGCPFILVHYVVVGTLQICQQVDRVLTATGEVEFAQNGLCATLSEVYFYCLRDYPKTVLESQESIKARQTPRNY